MENQRQIIFKENGSAEWNEIGGMLTLKRFNDTYYDWVDRYYEGEKADCETWEDALEVLNTVGASSMAGKFDLLPAVVKTEQKSLSGLSEYKQCAVYNELGGYTGLFTLFEFAEYMDDDEANLEDWAAAEKYAKEEGYVLVPVL